VFIKFRIIKIRHKKVTLDLIPLKLRRLLGNALKMYCENVSKSGINGYFLEICDLSKLNKEDTNNTNRSTASNEIEMVIMFYLTKKNL
jgi:hypothetical protein